MIFKISELYNNKTPRKEVFASLYGNILCRIPFQIHVDCNPFVNTDDLAMDILLSTPHSSSKTYGEYLSEREGHGLLEVGSDIQSVNYIKTLFI